MTDAPIHAPHLSFDDDTATSYNNLAALFAERARIAGWAQAASEIDRLEAAHLALRDSERQRQDVRRFFAVFRAEHVTRQ